MWEKGEEPFELRIGKILLVVQQIYVYLSFFCSLFFSYVLLYCFISMLSFKNFIFIVLTDLNVIYFLNKVIIFVFAKPKR